MGLTRGDLFDPAAHYELSATWRLPFSLLIHSNKGAGFLGSQAQERMGDGLGGPFYDRDYRIGGYPRVRMQGETIKVVGSCQLVQPLGEFRVCCLVAGK